MTKKLYDLAVKTGEYTTREGETKGKWLNIGALLESDEGNRFLLIDRWFNPAGLPNPDNRGNVMVSLFKPKQRDESQNAQESGGGGSTNDDIDNIPF